MLGMAIVLPSPSCLLPSAISDARLSQEDFSMKIVDRWLPIKSQLQTVWYSLVAAMTTSSQLQVWQTRLANGDCSWHAYDPMTGRSACFGSETEMRVWIETQYYTR